MSILVWVALGGAVGAVARYGLSGWVQDIAPGSFPWGTIVVNVLGCFALGFAFRVLQFSVLPPALRAGVTVGFLGAFTTFSTFGLETVTLLRDGEWARAGAYLGGSVLFGLAAVLVGLGLAQGLLKSGG
jgi:CrcB protein